MSLVIRRMRMHAYQLFKHAYQLFKYACHGLGGPSMSSWTVLGTAFGGDQLMRDSTIAQNELSNIREKPHLKETTDANYS